MIEWLAVIVLVPAILVPAVLLFGFAGCQLVFPHQPGDPSPPERTYEVVLTEDRQRRNRCIVQRIEPIRLARSGSRVHLVLERPGDGDLVITQIFISRAAASGDPYDAAGDLTPVLSAPLAVAADPAHGLLELPPVEYQLDRTQPLLLAFDIGDVGLVRRGPNVANAADARAFVGPQRDPPLHEASRSDREPGYEAEDRFYIVKRIDVS